MFVPVSDEEVLRELSGEEEIDGDGPPQAKL